MKQCQTLEEIFGPVIYTYTRQDALNDGVLIDVSEIAREAGFKWPVAITTGVHALIENIPEKYQGVQDYAGRLRDVLYMASLAARRGGSGAVRFNLIMHYEIKQQISRFNRRTMEITWHTRKVIHQYVTLKMVAGPCGPEDPSPAITIMLPEED